MRLHKEVKTLGMPWESQYGYVQAVKVNDTIYVSGQLSHDDRGNMIGAAPLDDSGNVRITRTWKSRCDRVTPMQRRFWVGSASLLKTWSRKCSTSQT